MMFFSLNKVKNGQCRLYSLTFPVQTFQRQYFYAVEQKRIRLEVFPLSVFPFSGADSDENDDSEAEVDSP